MSPKQLEECVAKLIAEGKSEASAWAICTATLQGAGILKPGTQHLAKGKSKGKK